MFPAGNFECHSENLNVIQKSECQYEDQVV